MRQLIIFIFMGLIYNAVNAQKNFSLQLGLDGGFLQVNSYEYQKKPYKTYHTPRIAPDLTVRYYIPKSKLVLAAGARYSYSEIIIYEALREYSSKDEGFPKLTYTNPHVELYFHLNTPIVEKEKWELQAFLGLMGGFPVSLDKTSLSDEGSLSAVINNQIWDLDYYVGRAAYRTSGAVESGILFKYTIFENWQLNVSTYYRMGFKHTLNWGYNGVVYPPEGEHFYENKLLLFDNSGMFLNIGIERKF